MTDGSAGRANTMEGRDQSWGFNGPVGELIRCAVISGAYGTVAKRGGANAEALQGLADMHSAAATALCDGIGKAALLMRRAGLSDILA